MTAVAQEFQSASGMIRALRTVNQLILEAVQTESKQQLFFLILNKTLLLVPYNRAALWSLRGSRPSLLGVSGQTGVNQQAPLVTAWRELLGDLERREEARVLDRSSFPGKEAYWDDVHKQIGKGSILWLPIRMRGELAGGLWLERWSQDPWTDDEIQILANLMQGYGGAWERHARALAWAAALHSWRLLIGACLGLTLLYVLFLYPARLRVVAPCEVVPRDPVVVAAPLNGVVEDVLVEPGARVKAGAPLFQYDRRVAEEELKVVRQQVEIIQTRLSRAQVEAFADAGARAEIQTLRARLAQEQVRLRLAESQAKKLEVRAPVAGVVMIKEPHSWRGRAVRVGERVVVLVDPAKTMVRVWVPESDNIAFHTDIPVRVLLNVRPLDYLEGRIEYVANHTGASPQGVSSFVVEARWQGDGPVAKLGLKGTAILYGDESSVAYWLLRKPMAAVRRFFGI